MTFVVTEKCIKCKYMDCTDPCPVDCFHEGPQFLVIDPEVCIDCNVCVTECPVNAIYQDKDLPAEQKIFVEINRHFSGSWPQAAQRCNPLPERDKWAQTEGKRKYILQELEQASIKGA